MKQVFVDTSGFYSLLVVDDDAHTRALDVFKQANEETWRLVATNTVVVKTYALLLHRTRERRAKANRIPRPSRPL